MTWHQANAIPDPGVEVTLDYGTQRFVLPDGTPILNLIVNWVRPNGFKPGMMAKVEIIPQPAVPTPVVVLEPVPLDRDVLVKEAMTGHARVINLFNSVRNQDPDDGVVQPG